MLISSESWELFVLVRNSCRLFRRFIVQLVGSRLHATVEVKEKMVVDEPISKSLVVGVDGECTREICAKRSRCLEVACDGVVANCRVSLISKVDGCGFLVGVEVGSQLVDTHEINSNQCSVSDKSNYFVSDGTHVGMLFVWSS